MEASQVDMDAENQLDGVTKRRFRTQAEVRASPPEQSQKEQQKRNKSNEAVSKSSDVLILVIGGEKTVRISRSVLTCVGGSKLAEMFSGHWDESLPKNEEDQFVIDQKPEIFLPLRDFLYSLACMAPSDAGSNPTPPMTPSFSNPSDEIAFRRMVDAYGLTNALYNYEIYKANIDEEDVHYNWNNRALVSQESSVLEFSMTGTHIYSLDRPLLSFGPSHGRKVQSFEVTITENFDGGIGWVRQGRAATNSMASLVATPMHIAFLRHAFGIGFFFPEKNDTKWHALPGPHVHGSCSVRCVKNMHSGELEWYVDGNVVAASGSFGWSIPTDVELIPLCGVKSGSCQFTDVQLEM